MRSICSLRRGAITAIVIAIVAALGAPGRTQAQPASTTAQPITPTLRDRVAALDRAVFDAFNRCEIDKLTAFFDPALEFYHDNAGVTWGREQFINDIKQNVCGKFTRQLQQATLEVWPIGEWGAVYSGVHHFCPASGARCTGSGRFLHVLQKTGDTWRVTRVVSFDHRALP